MFDLASFRKIYPDLPGDTLIIRSVILPPALPSDSSFIDWANGDASYQASLQAANTGTCELRIVRDAQDNPVSVHVCRIQLDRTYIIYFVEE